MTSCPGVLVAGGEKSALAARAQHHRLGGLTVEIYLFTALEARSTRSSCCRGWVLGGLSFWLVVGCFFAITSLSLSLGCVCGEEREQAL